MKIALTPKKRRRRNVYAINEKCRGVRNPCGYEFGAFIHFLTNWQQAEFPAIDRCLKLVAENLS